MSLPYTNGGRDLTVNHPESQITPLEQFLLDYIDFSHKGDYNEPRITTIRNYLKEKAQTKPWPTPVEPIGEDILPESLVNAAGFQSVPQIDLMFELERGIKELGKLSFTARMKKRHELLEKFHLTRKP